MAAKSISEAGEGDGGGPIPVPLRREWKRKMFFENSVEMAPVQRWPLPLEGSTA